MDILRLMGLFAVIPTVLLITVSFFVMFTLSKVEKSPLRIFGMVAVGLLWIAALIVFSGGLLLVADGPDYFGDHGLSNPCKCQCLSKMDPGCGMKDFSYHKKMKNPHQGMMINPHEGMMNPHEGIMMNSTRQDMMNTNMTGSGMKK